LLLPIEKFHSQREALFKTAGARLVPVNALLEQMNQRTRPSVRDVMAESREPLIQPRCGVGDHQQMKELLLTLQNDGQGDILTLTVDSYTRLNLFEKAAKETKLNGYPIVHHGPDRLRDLEAALAAPLQVRHGSPDGRWLAEISYAGGLTAFEGAGISYNLPYCKKVPLEHSLRSYQYIDRLTGLISGKVRVDRETFGSLSAVLVPPSISIAISLIEAGLAAEQGVKCVTISFPQTGSIIQDVAALEAIRELWPVYARRMALPEVELYTSFHQWMGVFPQDSAKALSLISSGIVSAVLGRATKSIIKTHHEALGIPSPEVNAFALRFCKGLTKHLRTSGELRMPEDEVLEEKLAISREVLELLDPIFQSSQGEETDLIPLIVELFASGRLDIPFPASLAAKGAVIPARDGRGRIRYLAHGGLPFSGETLRYNKQHLESRTAAGYKEILGDIRAIAEGV
jgi:methylaspartate mutase epsilon subunit